MRTLDALKAAKAALLAGAVASAAPQIAAAQSAAPAVWPVKPIRMIAPQAAGGGPERVLRTIADGLGKRLGQPVVLDYRPGAAGNIGAAELARSPADGYTWLLGIETITTINPYVYKNVGFKTADVAPVSLVGSLVFVLACHPSVGVKTPMELAARAKSRPMTYAASGLGSPDHITSELMLEAGQFRMASVPYRGPGPAVQDLIGGQVDCAFLPASTVQEHIRSGRLQGLAVATKKRIANLPDLPTMQEAGFRDFDATFYIAMFAPRGVPADVRSKFEKALDETIRSPEAAEAFAANNVLAEGTSADTAQRELQRAATKWHAVVKRMNLSLD